MTIVIITTMNVLTVCLMLCGLLTLSETLPQPNVTDSARLLIYSTCLSQQSHCSGHVGSFCPQCDRYGYFVRQQCWASTGYCWCVNPYSGDEIPNTRTGPGTTPIDCSTITRCPSGWEQFGDKCFKFVDSAKKWTEAELYCQFDRANLASVHSSIENHFLQYLTRGSTTNFPRTWIGGFYFMNAKVWMWTDGSQFNYEDWVNNTMPMSPDNCLLMNYGIGMKWINSSCADSFPFVCARKL